MEPYLQDNYSEKVTLRLTTEQKKQIEESAMKSSVSPSEWTRRQIVKALGPDTDSHPILSATEATAVERLLLAKLCKQEELLRRLFGGLLEQLNEGKIFDRETAMFAVECAESNQYRKADELLASYFSLNLEKKNGQN